MKVVLLEERRLSFLNLPNNVEGSFWITNPFKPSQKLLNIEARNGKWHIISNQGCYLKVNNTPVAETTLELNNLYSYVTNEVEHLIYVTKSYDETVGLYQITQNAKITIGNDMKKCDIVCDIPSMGKEIAGLSKSGDVWTIKCEPKSYVYINNQRNFKELTSLKNGDNIFIFGLNITILGDLMLINNPGLKKFNIPSLSSFSIQNQEEIYSEVNEVEYYKSEDYFFKTPRLRRFISTFEIEVSPPPAEEKKEEMPVILLMGPMMTMGASSAVSLINLLMRISSGETDMKNSWPTLVTSIAMLTTTFLWPTLTRKYQDIKRHQRERKRRKVYSLYLKRKEELFKEEFHTQSQILLENFVTPNECNKIIIEKQRVLWERKASQKDFLTIRVGIGNVPLDAKIKFPEEEFVMEEDDMKEQAKKMINLYKMIPSSPITYSIYNKKATAIMGLEDKLKSFIDNIILQLITFHSYDDLKLVVFTTENSNVDWNYIKNLPHVFSNDRKIRFFSTTEDEEKTISNYLEEEFIARISKEQPEETLDDEHQRDETTKKSQLHLPYYIIITDDFLSIRKLGITKKILSYQGNLGFSFLIKENRLGRLPSECETFININAETSTILSTEIDNSYQIDFKDEIDDLIDMNKCSEILANIPIEFSFSNKKLPDSLSFLDMFGIGKIEQLNTINTWRLNDPTKTLKALVGVNDTEEPIYLDLHEKAHGPHGLIAGTTGSGKSEFIITYILSLALSYSPNEVAFILIDYKGGGLAGAFENKKNNIRLPHLAGTITNLDKSEINRALVSIDSELKKRQQRFNEARDELGESTMDIYKYQKLFREKKLQKPLPHLFIICDEFAELKAQQPDFMDNLISTARIGRSLGVHLILATQKPSGVVNDQIWSNTKFRVCLKVADQADSNEMLKKPDAAFLTNAGRFYLQVGYDEIYVLGQSGYTGSPYYSKDVSVKEIDRSLTFIDNIGEVIKTVDVSANNKVKVESNGDQLSNTLKYITDIAQKENTYAERLWLDNIPGKIFVADLIKKYSYTPNKNDVEAIIGEYDDPTRQCQGILTLTLNDEGNTIIFGQSGIGKEMFLKSIIYSCSIMYSTRDINFYIIDFGSEALRIFEKLPHVGDIAFSQDKEKIVKLLKIISEEIMKRKALLADYNGDYRIYNQSNQEKLPIFTVIINSFESFRESFSGIDEILSKMAREGSRYGVIMILTASSQSGMYRLISNFPNTFALDMNSKEEYNSALGRIGNIYPADFTGRGLFKRDLIYEFQTPLITEDENLIEHIKNIGANLTEANTYIPPKVPVLPEEITLDMLYKDNLSLKDMPIGIEKETLSICNYDFKKDKGTIISSSSIGSIHNTVLNILKIIHRGKFALTAMIDAEDTFANDKEFIKGYFSSESTNLYESLSYFAKEKLPVLPTDFVLFISGFDKISNIIENRDLENLLKDIKASPKSTIIFADSLSKLKKINYESWFTENITNFNGIWIGKGVGDQSIIKVEYNSKYNAKIENDYAWIVNEGEAILIKLINEGIKEDEK